MRKERHPYANKPMAYQLPEDEFRALKLLREHLLLLAELTAPVTQAEAEEPVPISRFALAHCFERLAGELEPVIRKTWWPGE